MHGWYFDYYWFVNSGKSTNDAVSMKLKAFPSFNSRCFTKADSIRQVLSKQLEHNYKFSMGDSNSLSIDGAVTHELS